MAILKIPTKLSTITPLFCSICRVKLHLDKATAGMLAADNRQAWACVSHFSEVELLIVGWADFMAHERAKQKVGNSAWLNP
jgi:hypothetical protein